MDKSFAFYILLLLFSVFLSAISQVMLKKAAMKRYKSVWNEYLNPLVIFAYFIFFTTTLVNVFAYRALPLSLGLVLETTGYLYTTVFGIFIFKESFSLRKAGALCLIIGGVVLYAFAS